MKPFLVIWTSPDDKNAKTITSQVAIVDLNRPPAFRFGPGGEGLRVQHVHLERDVRIRDDKGTPNDNSDDTRISTSTLDYDEPTHEVSTQSPVVIKEPGMEASGDGMLIRLRSGGGIGPSVVPSDDPERVANAILEQNRKLAKLQLVALKDEAETLRARLTRVEAGIVRWDRVLDVLTQAQAPSKGSPQQMRSIAAKTASYFNQPYEWVIPPPEGSPNLEGKKVVILSAPPKGPSRNTRRSSETCPGCSPISCGRRSRRSRSSSLTRSRPGSKHTRTGPTPPTRRAISGADMAIFLEVESFQSQTPGDLNMVHGESKVHIQVFELDYPKNSRDKPIKDQPKEAHNIYDGYAESSFPNRGPLPIDSGTSRAAFKHTFLKIVVKEISWHFASHREEDSIFDRPATCRPGR